MPRTLLTRQPAAQEGEGVAERKFFRGRGAAVAVFQLARFEAAVTHDHAVRNPEKLRVCELDSGTFVTIVEQHVDTRCLELVVETFCGFAYTGRLRCVDGDHDQLEGRN